MTIQQFLTEKRDEREHSPESINWFISGLVSGSVSDYQASAWLMAAYLNGLSPAETTALTLSMASSGKTLDLRGLPHPLIDKHSTGGVGDAVTIALLPLIAACGLTMVKMSGRGLGFTGGTIDKLEAVPGFRTDLSLDEMVGIASRVGCALSAQTADLAPADKILYALRDATATIDCIPLIAASVMSKKLAANADVIVLDVKVGNGAFMQDMDKARLLAETMVEIGERAGKKVRALISEMNQPLAPFVGNALEVYAALDCVRSGFTGRLGEAVRELASVAIELSGSDADLDSVIRSGKAIDKCREWFAAQGGDGAVVDDPDLLIPRDVPVWEITSPSSGVLTSFVTAGIGEAVRSLGGGRLHKDDGIDPRVGVHVLKSLGDSVASGEAVFRVYGEESRAGELRNCFRVAPSL